MLTHVKFMGGLNIEWLCYFLSCLTLFLEFIFIFIFFRKRYRLLVFIIGSCLHLGIIITFPIPWFGLTASAIYLLLLPVSFWGKLFHKRKKTPLLTFYYDKDCPLCVRTIIIIIIISSLDWFSRISFKTVQYDASSEKILDGTNEITLLNDVHVIKKGKVYSGVDSYIQVFNSFFLFSSNPRDLSYSFKKL